MEIKFVTRQITLSDAQKEQIESKIVKLTRLAERLADESTEIRIDVEYHESKKQSDQYEVVVTFFVPQDVIRGEAHAATIETAVDDAIDKLRHPIEKYKAKIEHLNDHK